MPGFFEYTTNWLFDSAWAQFKESISFEWLIAYGFGALLEAYKKNPTGMFFIHTFVRTLVRAGGSWRLGYLHLIGWTECVDINIRETLSLYFCTFSLGINTLNLLHVASYHISHLFLEIWEALSLSPHEHAVESNLNVTTTIIQACSDLYSFISTGAVLWLNHIMPVYLCSSLSNMTVLKDEPFNTHINWWG